MSGERTAESHEDLRVLRMDGREITLVGTAHISKESAELVARVIRERRPDRVCVELDPQRYEALQRRSHWEQLDLRQVLKQRRLATLLVNLVLAAYQRRLGDRLGVAPGTELLEATRVAEECGIPFDLCDREIRITLLRAWRSMSLWQKSKLLSVLLTGVFQEQEITEDELRELRRADILNEVIGSLAEALPSLKRVLIDERDRFLAEKVRAAEGRRVVLVVGAGHIAGIERELAKNEPADLTEVSTIPKAPPLLKWIGWAVPALILASLAAIAWRHGAAVAGENLRFWAIVNGVPSAIGAAVAMAHPLTILAALVAAPITSLTPVIGAGYVVAFVQAYLRPPLVRDFQNLAADAGSLRNWWKNRLLRVLLAFVFSTLGSMIGTYVGGYEIVSNLF